MDTDNLNRFKKVINTVIILAIMVMFLVTRLYGTIAIVIYLVYLLYKVLPSIYMIIGRNRYSVINSDAGFKWFEKAYNTNRLSVTNQVFYAYLLLKHENLIYSEIILENLIKQDIPNRDEAIVFLNYSLVLWKKGDNEKSLQYAESAYKIIRNTVIYGTLGYLINDFCSVEKALKFNEEAYSFNSSDFVISDNYALALLNSNDNDIAEQILIRVTSSGPKFPEPYYNLGCLYLKKKMYSEAKTCFEKALVQEYNYLSSLKKELVKIKLQESILLQGNFLE